MTFSEAGSAPDARRTIMVVEDDSDIRESLSHLLQEEGFAVQSCADGKCALDVLQVGEGARPELVVLDLMMPIMDGWEFRMKQRADPGLADIPVLAISADGTPKAAVIHADAYLKKPFRAEDFLHEVARVLLETENRRMRHRLAHTQRLTALGTVAASVGHEVGNPLTHVLANLRSIEHLVAPMRNDLARLQQASSGSIVVEACGALEQRIVAIEALAGETYAGAERIRAIVRGLRLMAGGTAGPREPLRLADVVAMALRMTEGHTVGRGRVVRDLGDDAIVRGDETQLVQVFVNLVVNAAQALLPERAATNVVRVSLRREGGRAVVEVADTGPGIPPSVRARLFEPFFTTKRAEGLGLGLALCRDIVVAHGGSIDVDSELGEGSKFRVMLPAV